jgi:hypothetical protein
MKISKTIRRGDKIDYAVLDGMDLNIMTDTKKFIEGCIYEIRNGEMYSIYDPKTGKIKIL